MSNSKVGIPEGLSGPKFELLREFSWEKYVYLIVGVVCCADAFLSSTTPLAEEGFLSFIRSIFRDGAFHSALLFCVLFYLSEARFRSNSAKLSTADPVSSL